MPFDSTGKFYPKPFTPLDGSLFDLIPPDHPDVAIPATDEDWHWYNQVVSATAELLVFVVDNVRSNYNKRRGIAFSNRTVHVMHDMAERISVLLDGELTRTQVAKQVNKAAKQFGLVVYSTEKGDRENWPMASRNSFTPSDAQQFVRDAFWARWPGDNGTSTREAT